MSETISITIDGVEVKAQKGQKIIEAAEAAGIYIPRLCWMKDLMPAGACRVCTVLVNGRPQTACTQPVAEGLVVQNDTPELKDWRRGVVEMLFVEGNHYCMFCERSGNCRLQALAYRLGIETPRYAFQYPQRPVDASHPDILFDANRCILCGLCGRTARHKDGKVVYGPTGRGLETRTSPNGRRLADTQLSAGDQSNDVCPVGCIIRKQTAFRVPVGKRLYDEKPIGSEIEATRK